MFERCNYWVANWPGTVRALRIERRSYGAARNLRCLLGSEIATLLNFSDGSPITPHSLLKPCMTAYAISIDASEYGAAALALREPGTRAQRIYDRIARPDRRVYGFGCCCARKCAVPRYLV